VVSIAALLLHSRRRWLTVLLTPLNSIGRQHVKAFQDAGLDCAGLFGSSTELEHTRIHAAVTSRQLVILVAFPEAMVNNLALLGVIKTMGSRLLAFDQAHLFDSWARWRPDLSQAASRFGSCRQAGPIRDGAACSSLCSSGRSPHQRTSGRSSRSVPAAQFVHSGH